MASIKRFYVGWFSMVMGVAIATLPTTTQAQSIAPDGSLPTTVSPLVDDTYTIGGGLRSDSNLFHSFSEFGLPNGETAEFISGAGILNIISRVTGGNVSTIDGTLRTTIEGTTTGQIADVNLFIINPNGLTFTENARLDIGRSFIGSTAGSLLFEDGTQLETGSATDFSGTASMPVTFEIADGGGPINVVDTGIAGFVNNDDVGLQVSLENTLALIGGDITLEGGILQAPKGVLYLSALDSGESVNLSVDPSLGSIFFEIPDSNTISTDAESSISLDDSILTANLEPMEDGTAGAIQLRAASSISLNNRTQIQSLVEGDGAPGGIGLTTSTNGIVSLDNDSAVFATVENGGTFVGDVGLIFVSTGFLSMDNGSQLLSIIRGEGPNGDPEEGTGEPGNIFVIAPQGIELRGQGNVIDGQRFSTGISTELDGRGTGATLSDDGGNLLDVLLNSSDSSSFGDLFGTVLLFTDGDLIVDDTAFIFTGTSSNGNAGAVFVSADNIFVENGGSISSSATGDEDGSAGIVFAIAENDIVVRGPGSNINSAVASGASAFAVNLDDQNGAVLLFARRVGVLNNGIITVNNQSAGEAGDIIIGADLVALNRAGDVDLDGNFIDGISAVASDDADGGNILIGANIFGENNESSSFFTVLANESNISTSTEFGNGGTIAINVFPEIIAAPSQDSNILTETQGNNLEASINLNSNPFLRNIAITSEFNSPFSNDISAASGTNADGTINGGSLENSLLQDPLLLPADLVDPSRLIAQGCAAGDLQAARNIGDLTLTGRDGLSATPEEQLSSSASTSTLATLDDAADDLAQAEAWAAANREQPPEDAAQSAAQSAESDVNETTEAQTWRYGSDGQVVLMAQATRVPSSSVFPGFSCDVF